MGYGLFSLKVPLWPSQPWKLAVACDCYTNGCELCISNHGDDGDVDAESYHVSCMFAIFICKCMPVWAGMKFLWTFLCFVTCVHAPEKLVLYSAESLHSCVKPCSHCDTTIIQPTGRVCSLHHWSWDVHSTCIKIPLFNTDCTLIPGDRSHKEVRGEIIRTILCCIVY